MLKFLGDDGKEARPGGAISERSRESDGAGAGRKRKKRRRESEVSKGTELFESQPSEIEVEEEEKDHSDGCTTCLDELSRQTSNVASTSFSNMPSEDPGSPAGSSLTDEQITHEETLESQPIKIKINEKKLIKQIHTFKNAPRLTRIADYKNVKSSDPLVNYYNETNKNQVLPRGMGFTSTK